MLISLSVISYAQSFPKDLFDFCFCTSAHLHIGLFFQIKKPFATFATCNLDL